MARLVAFFSCFCFFFVTSAVFIHGEYLFGQDWQPRRQSLSKWGAGFAGNGRGAPNRSALSGGSANVQDDNEKENSTEQNEEGESGELKLEDLYPEDGCLAQPRAAKRFPLTVALPLFSIAPTLNAGMAMIFGCTILRTMN